MGSLFCGLHNKVGLNNEHCVSKGEKPVFFLYRNPVRIHNVVIAGQRADEHDQCTLRQMEVGDQAVEHLKLESRIDEDIGPPFARFDASFLSGDAFERAAAGNVPNAFYGPRRVRHSPGGTCRVRHAA